MKLLPSDVSPYKKTPTFSQDTVPKGLLSDHSTKSGTWGLLTVETGQLTYVITQPGCEEELVIRPNSPGVIAPQETHYVVPNEAVTFHVQFLK